MASTSKYSIGVYLNEECHKTTYNSHIESKHIEILADEDQLLIKLRNGTEQQLKDICNHDEKYFLVKYDTFKYKRCDPLLVYKKSCKGQEIVLLIVAYFSLAVISYIYFSSPHSAGVVG